MKTNTYDSLFFWLAVIALPLVTFHVLPRVPLRDAPTAVSVAESPGAGGLTLPPAPAGLAVRPQRVARQVVGHPQGWRPQVLTPH